jgi:hypothetical protein
MIDSKDANEGSVDLDWLKSTDEDAASTVELSIGLRGRESKTPKVKSNGVTTLDKTWHFEDHATYGGKLVNIMLRLVQVQEEVVKSYFSFDQDLKVRISDIARGPTDCYFLCVCNKKGDIVSIG